MINTNEKEQMFLIQSQQRRMGEMVSMIAHQWRQPLAAIAATAIDLRMKIYLNAVESKKQNNDELIEYINEQLEDIEGYTQSLTSIIDDFRDFHKPQYEKSTIQINQTVTRSLNIIKGVLFCSDIKVNLELESILDIECYENEIIHILLNLFNNSIENFNQNGIIDKEITVRTKDSKNGVVISFEDNGGGINNENLEEIFSPYFTTKTNSFGVGLGLYMNKKILKEHHNGDIIVENTNDGIIFKMEINR
jgi:signal transduction histidine kinase